MLLNRTRVHEIFGILEWSPICYQLRRFLSVSEKNIIVDESPRQKDMSAREVLKTALTTTLAMDSHNFSKVLKRPKMHQGQ